MARNLQALRRMHNVMPKQELTDGMSLMGQVISVQLKGSDLTSMLCRSTFSNVLSLRPFAPKPLSPLPLTLVF